MESRVDHTALKFNQACIITLLLLAFLLDAAWLVGFVSAVMLIGTIWPRAGLFKQVYIRLLRPAGILHPNLVVDNPAPHLFAQGLGGVVLIVALGALLSGATIVGWLLVAAVITLAAVNLLLGFCLGCFLYFQLARRGIRLNLRAWHTT